MNLIYCAVTLLEYVLYKNIPTLAPFFKPMIDESEPPPPPFMLIFLTSIYGEDINSPDEFANPIVKK